MNRVQLRFSAIRIGLLVLFVALLLAAVQLLTAPAAARSRLRLIDRAVGSLADGRHVEPRIEVAAGGRAVAPSLLAWYRLDGGRAYAIQIAAEGYRTESQLLVGVESDGTVFAVQMLACGEAAWAAACGERFLVSFVGSGGSRPVPRRLAELDESGLAAVSGATLSFRVLGAAVDEASRFVEAIP